MLLISENSRQTSLCSTEIFVTLCPVILMASECAYSGAERLVMWTGPLLFSANPGNERSLTST